MPQDHYRCCQIRGLWAAAVLGKQLSLLLLLLFLLLLVSNFPGPARAATGYQKDKTYCYDEFESDDAIREALKGFSDVADPVTSYNGAKYSGSGTTFSASLCRDVTTVGTTMKVTNSEFITKASDASEVSGLQEKVSQAVKSEVESGSNSALQSRLSEVHVTLDSASDASVLFNVQFVLKGHNDALRDTVETEVTTVVLADGKLNGTLTVDSTGMTFSVLKCTDSPPSAPANGAATPTQNFAGEQVTYTCNDDYRLSTDTDRLVFSCSRETLTWTATTTTFTCDEDKRCMKEPPAAPPHSIRHWDGDGDRADATEITYDCRNGYIPMGAVNTVTSKCSNKAWTAISGLICEFNGCQHSPPQLVDNGDMTWDNSSVNGTRIVYTCKPGFESTVHPEPEVMCVDQVWGKLPKEYRCVTYQQTGVIKEEMYLTSVTIPSCVGLTLVILVLLCCSRPESPLCRCCSDRRRGKNPSFA